MATLAYVEPGAMPSPAAIEGLLAAGHAGLAVYVPDDGAVARSVGMGRRDVAARSTHHAAIVSSQHRPAADRHPRGNRRRRAALPADLIPHGHAGYAQDDADALTRAAPNSPRSSRSPRHPNVFVKLSGFYAVSDPSHAWPHFAAGPLGYGAGRAASAPTAASGAPTSARRSTTSSFAQTITVPGLDAFNEATRRSWAATSADLHEARDAWVG